MYARLIGALAVVVMLVASVATLAGEPGENQGAAAIVAGAQTSVQGDLSVAGDEVADGNGDSLAVQAAIVSASPLTKSSGGPTTGASVAETTVAGSTGVITAIESKRPHPTTTITRPHGTTTTTRPHGTTTTTRPHPGTTTTTRPHPATTTTAPTPTTRPTTTTAPTTTTVPPVPDREPVGDAFIALLRGTEGPQYGNVFWWDATYKRELPYTPNTGWIDGDRCGYKAMYTFLTLNGQIVGRATFMRVEDAASYAVVNDKFMLEAIRFYNGSVAPPGPGPGQDNELGDCPTPSLSYEPFTGAGQLPTITFNTTAGALLEVRDYKPLVHADNIKFRQTEATAGRITVVAYENNVPVIVVYYESLSPDVVMDSDL